MNEFNITECVAWAASALASIYGVAITENPLCLLALFIPAIVYTKPNNKEK